MLLSIQLRSQFRLAAVLQPVHRFMQQRVVERRIAAVVVAAEANAVVGWRVEPVKACRAVVEQQHARVAGALHLGDQSKKDEAGRCTQDF